MRPLPTVLVALLALTSTACAAGVNYDKGVKTAVNYISGDTLYEHLTVLASDRYLGRFSGSFEGKWAGDYVAMQFSIAGLQPGGTEGYFQPYPLEGAFNTGLKKSDLASSNWAGLIVPRAGDRVLAELSLGDDLRPLATSGSGRIHLGLVFAGYGITTEGYDSYDRLEVRGRIAVVLEGVPEIPGIDAAVWTREKKVAAAESLGVRGLVFIPDPSAEAGPLPAGGDFEWPPSGEPRQRDILAIGLSSSGAEKLFAPVSSKLDSAIKSVKKGKSRGKELEARLELAVFPEPETYGRGRNVIGIYPGTDPELKNETIVISAHYDHIGQGAIGIVKGKRGDIFNGCDDNASGTSGLIEIAQALREGQPKLRRSIMLIAFDSEEVGLVGSKTFTANPTIPLQSIIADLNMDMISKGHPTEMLVGGRDSSEAIDQILGRIARRFRLTLSDDGMDQYMKRSDQWNFLEKGIPAIFLFGGIHSEYHSPDDDYTSKSLHPKKMETIAKLMLLVAVELSERDGRP